MNNVVLIGRLTRDPELRYLQSGMAVSRFTLAVDKDLSKEKKQEMGSNKQPTADFINIVVWGKQAENCANYLVKGRLVAIQGRIQTRNFTTQDGEKKFITEVVGERTQFLEWGDKNTTNVKPTQVQTQNSTKNKNSNFDDFDGFGGFGELDDDIPF